MDSLLFSLYLLQLHIHFRGDWKQHYYILLLFFTNVIDVVFYVTFQNKDKEIVFVKFLFLTYFCERAQMLNFFNFCQKLCIILGVFSLTAKARFFCGLRLRLSRLKITAKTAKPPHSIEYPFSWKYYILEL